MYIQHTGRVHAREKTRFQKMVLITSPFNHPALFAKQPGRLAKAASALPRRGPADLLDAFPPRPFQISDSLRASGL